MLLIEDPSADVLSEVYRLRVRAWRARTESFDQSIELWSDAFDAAGKHFVLVDNNAPVAAARVTIHAAPTDGPDGENYEDVSLEAAPPPIAFISRLVVCPSQAGKGLSTRLDAARIEYARRSGCRSVMGSTHAGARRIAQLERLGFKALFTAPKQTGGPLSRVACPVVLVLTL